MNVGCLISVVLFVLSGVALIATAVVPATGGIDGIPGLMQALQAVLCSPEETLTVRPVSTGMRGFGTFFSADFSCVNAAGRARSVNDPFSLFSVGAFLVPFFLGLFFFMAGAAQIARRQAEVKGAIPKAKAMPAMPSAQRGTLTERLAALEDAYHKRQISEEEYRELRKQLLDQFASG